MKPFFTSLALTLAGLGAARAAFDPVPLNPASFTHDVVVEVTAPAPVGNATTAAMDSGATNNTGNVWYEQGYNTAAPLTGIPPAGSTFTHFTNALKTYTMPASYLVNNAVYLNVQVPTGTLTLTTPTSATNLSLLGAAGNGPVNLNYTIRYQDASVQTGAVAVLDWFNGANPAWIANGRVGAESGNLANVNSGNPRLYSFDIALTSAVAVTSIDFRFVSGGRASIFALSGASENLWLPIPVTGFNRDVVVEASGPVRGFLTNNTTATMDAGTANVGNTWYEIGYNRLFPSTGLPAAGSTVTSLSLPDHQFVMPPSYTAPNAALITSNLPVANLTLATPAAFTALSILCASGGGNLSNVVTLQFDDGSTESSRVIVRDWFNNAPVAYNANGRVDTTTRTMNTVNAATQNPRLYELPVVLTNTTSLVTNISITPLTTAGGAKAAFFAVAGTSGPLPPLIGSQPASIAAYQGSNLTFNVTLVGGTPPITWSWQKRIDGTFTALTDGGNITGTETPSLTIASATLADAGDYRFIASNAGGSVTGSVFTVAIVSTLPDVTAPADAITGFGGASPAGEAVSFAINNNTSKYLNFGSGPNNQGSPFVGPIGLVVSPVAGFTRVEGIRIFTANDAEERDPTSFSLEGSPDGGLTWTLIVSNSLSLPSARNAGALALNPLTQPNQQVMFNNADAYFTYRLSFWTVKNAGAANSCQIAEVELLGTPVTAPPVIVRQPLNVNVVEGANPEFSISAIGSAPLGYQWYYEGEPVANATNATLRLVEIDGGSAGTYFCVVSNTAGSATSANGVLSVFPAAGESYPQYLVSSSPFAWFRLDELDGSTAFDIWGGHNGVYSNATLNVYGYNVLDPDPAAAFGSVPANSYVGDIQGIDFASDQAAAKFSILAWVRGGPQTTDAGIVTKGNGGGGEQFNLDTGGPNHAFRFFVRETNGTVRLCNSTNVPDGNWHQLAAVVDVPAGTVSLYVDGVLAATNIITSGVLPSSRPVTIGSRQSGAGAFDLGFVGRVDEVLFYRYALTPSQVLEQFAASGNRPSLTVLADDQSKFYGAPLPTFTVTYSDFVGDDDESILTGAPVLSTLATPSSPAGEYLIHVNQGTLFVSKGYNLVFVSGVLDVVPAPLIVKADNQARTEGLPNPTLTVSYDGFVNGDDASDLTGAPDVATPADAASPAGDYPIGVQMGTLENPNYRFVFASGTLTVSPKPTITNLVRTGNNLSFSWPTVAGQTYQVLYRDAIDTGDWLPQGPAQTGTGADLSITIDVTAAPHRFYIISTQ